MASCFSLRHGVLPRFTGPLLGGIVLAFIYATTSHSPFSRLATGLGSPLTLGHAETVETLTVLATNDLHGAVERLPAFGSLVQAHREALGARVLLLDAGDQFQGTLLSNQDEGQTVFDFYAKLGYTAVIPGNHDYDFGPIGWLEDQVRGGESPSSQAPDGPRGALLRLARQAPFPLLSANTWSKPSLRDVTGAPIPAEHIESSECRLPADALPIDFTLAEAPDFLRSTTEVPLPSGLRVGIFGLDHAKTPAMTTSANVSDLCFEDELTAAVRTIDLLSETTDLRILILHGGDTPGEKSATLLVEKILEARPEGLHAVVAGHTHMTHLNWVRGVPIVQSGTEGNAFGRIDFRLDATTHRLVPQGIRAVAGIPITIQECAPQTDGWCEKDSNGTVRWSGVAVHPQPELQKTLDESREALRPLAERVLGEVLSAPLTRSRISASPLTNLLTDLLKKVSGAEIALLNTGGIRADLPAGRLTYEHLFRTLPFNNHAVVAGPLQWSTLKALLQKSIETCGQYGALLPAGLRVEFRRECGAVKGSPTRPIDPGARLERVQLSTGEILLDRESGTEISADRGFIVATLDFLLSGGSNYREFTGTPLVVDLGIFRERLAETLARTPLVVHPDDLRDSRWVELPTEN